MPENPYESAARERKVSALVEAIDTHQVAYLVNYLEPSHWEVIAKTAGVQPPSKETVKMVRERINRRGIGSVDGSQQ